MATSLSAFKRPITIDAGIRKSETASNLVV